MAGHAGENVFNEKMATSALLHFAGELVDISSRAAEAFMLSRDRRLLRLHLLAEELGELARALGYRSEVATVDALADIAYVNTGTALAFDLPLTDAFEEVHASNMTKTPDATKHAEGKSGKGADYRPADLKGVLARYRASQRDTKKITRKGSTGL